MGTTLKNNISQLKYNYAPQIYNKTSLSEISKELSYYGFLLDVNTKLILIDLTEDEETRWKKLSKGHRSIIKKNLKEVSLDYYCYENYPMNHKDFLSKIRSIIKLSKSYDGAPLIFVNNKFLIS